MILDSYPASAYRDESQYWVAWSYFRKKNYEKAIGEFQRVIQQYPRSPLVPSSLLKMGDGYYNLRRYGQATNIYLQLIKEHPKSKEAPEADYGIILCLPQEKKREAFVARVESFVKRYPQHPLAGQALIQLGDSYEKNRMSEKALKTYQELIDLYPNGEGAEEAQSRMALLFKQERKWAESAEEMEKFISPAWRRKGLARALLTRGLRVVRERGVEVIRLNTVAEIPTRAKDLYYSVGFRWMKEFPRYRRSP